MVHIPSAQDRSELLSSSALAWFSMAWSDVRGTREPTLLVKASTLQLKYLFSQSRVNLVLVRLSGNALGYAVELQDGGGSPARLWSIVSTEVELSAIATLARGAFVMHLYNEATINVASAELTLETHLDPTVVNLIGESSPVPVEQSRAMVPALHDIFNSIDQGNSDPAVVAILTAALNSPWQEIRSRMYADSGAVLSISLLDQDEGGQQESLALWLTDNLQAGKVFRSPMLDAGPRRRELTDVLIPYEDGCILIESKALGLLSRKRLPDREILATQVAKHVRKAIRQLSGASRSVRSGVTIYDSAGRGIDFKRTAPIQAVVLIPDLSLLAGSDEFGGQQILKHTFEAKAFLQILDLAELFRITQAAHMLSVNAERVSLVQAFDVHLWSRYEKALQLRTPDFDFLLQIVPE